MSSVEVDLKNRVLVTFRHRNASKPDVAVFADTLDQAKHLFKSFMMERYGANWEAFIKGGRIQHYAYTGEKAGVAWDTPAGTTLFTPASHLLPR